MFRKRKGKRNMRWIRAMTFVIAAIVIFATTYALILPAITLEKGEAQTIPGVDLSRQEDAYGGERNLKIGGEETAKTGGEETTKANEETTKADEETTNEKKKSVSFRKVDVADTDTLLENAHFDLYTVQDGTPSETPLIEDLVSDAKGMLTKDGQTEFLLSAGTYHLLETSAPPGYQRREEPIVITVTTQEGEHGVTYDDGTSLSSDGGVSYDEDTGLYTLLITNSAGVELPQAGGMGTHLFYIVGCILAVGAAVMLVSRRRMHS